MICPPGFTIDTISVHQRQPIDTDRLIAVCVVDVP